MNHVNYTKIPLLLLVNILKPTVLSTPSKFTVSKVDTEIDNKKRIPEHLKELFEKSSIHLSPEEQDQVRELLCSYQHLFSTNTSDLGCTTLVEHQIDTGNSRPIKQRPRRIPLAKMKEAE